MGALEAKVAVISDGTSGIGLAIAQRFVKERTCSSSLGARRPRQGVAAYRANVTAIQADTSQLEDLDRVADAVRSAKGLRLVRPTKFEASNSRTAGML